MRIAPFAFFEKISREDIRDLCRITHRNDEAYAGALAVVLSIKAIINNKWPGDNTLFDILIPQLPDTRVRDRLIEINILGKDLTIPDIAKLGNNGYVVNSVPFALFAASQILDTNSSIAGQIAGAHIGLKNIPDDLLIQLKSLREYNWLKKVVDKTKIQIK